VGASELSLGGIEGVGAVTETVAINGPSQGTGCVWIEDLTVGTAPSAAGEVTLAAEPGLAEQSECVALDADAQREVELTLANEAAASGGVEGEAVFGLRGERDGETRTQAVPFRAQLSRPADAAVQAGVFGGLLGLGLLLPLLFQWWWNRRNARVGPADELRYADIPVEVTADDGDAGGSSGRDGGRVERVDGPTREPLTFRADDFRAVNGPAERRRSLSPEGLGLTFEGRTRRDSPPGLWRLFGEPVAEVQGAGDTTAQDGHRWEDHGAVGLMTPALQGSWALVAEELEWPSAPADGAEERKTSGRGDDVLAAEREDSDEHDVGRFTPPDEGPPVPSFGARRGSQGSPKGSPKGSLDTRQDLPGTPPDPPNAPRSSLGGDDPRTLRGRLIVLDSYGSTDASQQRLRERLLEQVPAAASALIGELGETKSNEQEDREKGKQPKRRTTPKRRKKSEQAETEAIETEEAEAGDFEPFIPPDDDYSR
jgi:hypothetical protein